MTSAEGDVIPWEKIGLKLDPEQAEPFLRNLPRDEAVRRLEVSGRPRSTPPSGFG